MLNNRNIFNADLVRTVLSENDLHINDVQLVPYHEVMRKLVKSKKSKIVAFEVDDTIVIDGVDYMTLDTCYKLFKHQQVTRYCHKSISEINFSNVIDVEKNILQFDEHIFTSFFIINDPKKFGVWVRYIEILDLLGLSSDTTITKKCNITTYEHLSTHIKFPKHNNLCEHKHARFINLSGISALFNLSSSDDIDEIRKFFEIDIPDAFDEYRKKIVHQFVYSADLLGVDLKERGILHIDDLVYDSKGITSVVNLVCNSVTSDD